MKTIAIISPGNMGHAVGRVLGSRGFDVVTALADRTPRTRGLAAQAGIRDLGDFEAVVGAADLVLSILPPAAAETAAETATAAMIAAGVAPLYADCNAIAPATTRRIAFLVGRAGAVFFIGRRRVGGVRPGRRNRAGVGPQDVLRSGDQRHGGAAVRAAGGRAAVGRCRQGATYAALRRRLPALPAKAPRWVEEMRQISATFEAVGVPGDLHRGAAALYELLSATPFADEPEEAVDTSRSLETTVAALAQVCAARRGSRRPPPDRRPPTRG